MTCICYTFYTSSHDIPVFQFQHNLNRFCIRTFVPGTFFPWSAANCCRPFINPEEPCQTQNMCSSASRLWAPIDFPPRVPQLYKKLKGRWRFPFPPFRFPGYGHHLPPSTTIPHDRSLSWRIDLRSWTCHSCKCKCRHYLFCRFTTMRVAGL